MSPEEEEAAAALRAMKEEDAGGSGSGAEADQDVRVHGNMQVSLSRFRALGRVFSWKVLEASRGGVCAAGYNTPAAVSRLLLRLFFVLRIALARGLLCFLFAARFEDSETSRTPCGFRCGTREFWCSVDARGGEAGRVAAWVAYGLLISNFGVLLMLRVGRGEETKSGCLGLGGVWVDDFELVQSYWQGTMFCVT